MGSVSDYEVMADAVAMLGQFGVDFEKRVVSAHRTPDLLCEYAKTAKNRGIGVIIAGAGGAAHLPGMVASMTPLPARRSTWPPRLRWMPLKKNTARCSAN